MPRYAKKQPLGKNQKKEVTKIAKSVMRLSVESNSYDRTFANSVGQSGILWGLNLGVNQGDGTGERVGTEIIMKSLNIRWRWTFGDTINTARMMIIYHKSPQGVSLTSADILQSDSTAYAPYSQFKKSTRSLYTVLYDKVFSLSDQSNNIVNIVKTINLKNKKTVYNEGTAGDITDVESGALYVYVISDSFAVAHPAYVGTTRLTYTS